MSRSGAARVTLWLACALSLWACKASKQSNAGVDSGAAGSQAGSSGAGAGAAGTSAASGGGGGAGNGTGSAGNGAAGSGNAGSGSAGSGTDAGGADAGAGTITTTFGNPNGHCAVPAAAMPEDSSHPTTVIGTGTAASCTSDALVAAVAEGGVITFNCGPDPVTITLSAPAKVVNDTGPKIIIDGGGKVTLSGGGKTRILYQNTCDQAQKWTTSHCQDQDTPQLTVQNLTFTDGNSTGDTTEGGGGGAIFVRGGRFKVINSRFIKNVCDSTGPDLGGAAIRVLSQSMGLPAYVVGCTFGGSKDLGNVCSNGGGLSSIGVSYTVLNSLFSYNKAIGNGANPAKSGTPGGGSGGAIYNDGNTYTLTVCGTEMSNNSANEGGGAIFYVSNDDTGTLVIKDSTLMSNPSAGFETQGLPGIFEKTGPQPQVSGSTIK